MDKNALFHKFVSFITSVHRVTDEMTKDVRPEGITDAQYKILEYIAVSQAVTLSEISGCMHMSMPNTSRELKKLTDKQLVEKTSISEDRRKQLIQLSEHGQAVMGQVFQLLQARFEERIRQVPEEELLDIERALGLLRSKLFM